MTPAYHKKEGLGGWHLPIIGRKEGRLLEGWGGWNLPIIGRNVGLGHLPIIGRKVLS